MNGWSSKVTGAIDAMAAAIKTLRRVPLDIMYSDLSKCGAKLKPAMCNCNTSELKAA